jgi:hypothetical protein
MLRAEKCNTENSVDVDVKAALVLSMLFSSRENFLSCAGLVGCTSFSVSGLVLTWESTTYVQREQLVVAPMGKKRFSRIFWQL